MRQMDSNQLRELLELLTKAISAPKEEKKIKVSTDTTWVPNLKSKDEWTKFEELFNSLAKVHLRKENFEDKEFREALYFSALLKASKDNDEIQQFSLIWKRKVIRVKTC
eukprot:GHVR01114184.1.p1 GENE.GHVR01114184.1~~GHVR01114184.1.p1  ORF type:complete len:109 (+),score=15.07 GHVR01114184.1:75-401(+)